MASATEQLHFVLIPLMAQGHMIPMVDISRLLAERGVIVSLVMTPHNAARFEPSIHRANLLGLGVRLILIPFPCASVGLPDGCENLDALPSRELLKSFYRGIAKLQEPLEELLQHQSPPPSCIISDKYLSWTAKTSQRFGVPRIVFHGMGCFSLLSSHNIKLHGSHLSVSSDREPFPVPGIQGKINITRAQLPGSFVSLPDLDDVRNKTHEAEMDSYGVIANSFQELEHGFAEGYEKAINKKVWCVGPVSLCNRDKLDMFERGNKASIDEGQILKWLDSMSPRSVVYVCLGSLCRLLPAQLIELGLGLEASKEPFIWVVQTGDRSKMEELENWFSGRNFEERIKGRGLLIKGWAPQVLILSHPSIRGFLTHCGWNSTIEAVCAGVPMITWPLFAEQFLNEKFIIEVLKIGVRIGVEVPVRWGDEEKVGVLVKRKDVGKAIELLMDGGEEGENRRKRARELEQMARGATEVGGTAYLNLSMLITDIMLQVKAKHSR